jgi:hypothetical protein
MVGQPPAFRESLRLFARLAACDAPVPIEGETGTGKAWRGLGKGLKKPGLGGTSRQKGFLSKDPINHPH